MPASHLALVPDAPVDPEPVPSNQRLEAMYRRHHLVIWRTLRRMGFGEAAAADYTQQAYLIALERIDDIKFGSEKAYLFSTAIGLARTAARKLRRMELSEAPELGSDEGQGASAITNRQVALQLLERILAGLDVDLVTVFSLYEIEGLSSPEIADLLSIPLGTVASRLRRARAAFQSRAAQLEASTSTSPRPLTIPPEKGAP